MHKNNMCVIYDRDTKYAMKLMNIINNDKQVPFGAQVFTEEEQLHSYLKDYEPKLLMVSEDMVDYKVKEDADTKLVVLCEEEDRQLSGEEAIGVYKYQSSHQILQQIIRQGLEGETVIENVSTKVVGVIGADVCSRNLLAITLAYLLGERESVLYLNLDEFSGLDDIFPAVEQVNLSDAFYLYKQNGYHYCDQIRRTIQHMERIDYIAPVQCADDISYMEPLRVLQFATSIGQELGYRHIVLDISSGVRGAWHILEHCDEVYTTQSEHVLLQRKQSAMEKYFFEMGMEYLVDKMRKVPLEYSAEFLEANFWRELEYSPNTRRIKGFLDGYLVS